MLDTSHASPRVTLGKYLRTVRNDRRMSLKEVETATDRLISNGYLCQLENDKIRKPSPNILHALATLYGIDYQDTMEMAGYAVQGERSEKGLARPAAFAELDITPAEELELIRYLEFLRYRRS